MSRLDGTIIRQMPCGLGCDRREALHGKDMPKVQWLGLWTCADCVKTMLGFRQQLDDDQTTALLIGIWR